MRKLLSVIVAAGFLAGLGCGDSTAPKDKAKPADKGTPPSGAPKDKDASGKMKDKDK